MGEKSDAVSVSGFISLCHSVSALLLWTRLHWATCPPIANLIDSMPFHTKITRARWVLGPFASEDMLEIAMGVRDSIAQRIHAGLNANDLPAKPLKPGRNGRRGYPDYKIARGLQPFRDWFWSGRTMRSLKVKSVNENRATIGFIDPNADLIAHVNNLRERAFGISPKDRQALNAAVAAALRKHIKVATTKVA